MHAVNALSNCFLVLTLLHSYFARINAIDFFDNRMADSKSRWQGQPPVAHCDVTDFISTPCSFPLLSELWSTCSTKTLCSSKHKEDNLITKYSEDEETQTHRPVWKLLLNQDVYFINYIRTSWRSQHIPRLWIKKLPKKKKIHNQRKCNQWILLTVYKHTVTPIPVLQGEL